VTETAVQTTIKLEADCGFEECAAFAGQLYLQLREGYETCSVMPIPETLAEWRDAHRTARKRAKKCRELGYRLTYGKRHQFADDILAINTSTPVRQKRPMSPGYSERPSETPDPVWSCHRHSVHPYGVISPEGRLVAYLWLYRSGQLALVSQILGHADHLENGIMYLLWDGMIAFESIDPDGFIVYNRHDSGTEGLRFYKQRVGLEETEVAWLP
jgi:hypothetical protein